MSSPEQDHSLKQPPSEPLPYYLASRFSGERPAGKAYNRLQETIRRADCDLSSFRFQLSRVYHVAAVGTQPPEELERRIKKILSAGVPAMLADDVLNLLAQRRSAATRLAPWVEGHYDPGLCP